MLVAGVEAETKGQTKEELARQRDAMIVGMLKAINPVRDSAQG